MLTSFLRNLELWLTAAGLLVVWVVALVVPQSVEDGRPRPSSRSW